MIRAEPAKNQRQQYKQKTGRARCWKIDNPHSSWVVPWFSIFLHKVLRPPRPQRSDRENIQKTCQKQNNAKNVHKHTTTNTKTTWNHANESQPLHNNTSKKHKTQKRMRTNPKKIQTIPTTHSNQDKVRQISKTHKTVQCNTTKQMHGKTNTKHNTRTYRPCGHLILHSLVLNLEFRFQNYYKTFSKKLQNNSKQIQQITKNYKTLQTIYKNNYNKKESTIPNLMPTVQDLHNERPKHNIHVVVVDYCFCFRLFVVLL